MKTLVRHFQIALFCSAFAACSVPEPPAEESGTVHTPPVEVAAIPVGHWYCDMGTVEYSRPEKGDGRCPVCRMKLVHKEHAGQGTAHGDFLKDKQAADAARDAHKHDHDPSHDHDGGAHHD
ncbi:MAG: hypothetical protein AAFQ82_13360 [Myxococcota bacterium]